ncbi:MAG: phosphoribosylformylglycinamidine synthase I [Phycisphaerae bacterium]
MANVKVLVLRTAGINCEEEVMHCWQLAGASPELITLDDMLNDATVLAGIDIVTLPGGFSYGDDLGGGVIFAERLVRDFSAPLRDHVERGGGIFGICNGFQILVRAGLLPGGDVGVDQVTVTHNDSNHFEARWVKLQCEAQHCPFLRDETFIELPIEHAEGKVIAVDKATVDGLHEKGHIALRYVDADGNHDRFPANPNGSIGGIAGLCDETGRIFGLMPHPDRHFHHQHHPAWTSRIQSNPSNAVAPDGLRIFKNAVAYWSARG